MESTDTKRERPAGQLGLVVAEPKTRPGRRRDRAAKQRALLLAAKKLFAHRGYDATTTREIAASAGCAEGLIHRYFNGKGGLFLALIQYRASQEAADLHDRLPVAATFQDEFLRLVAWEVERMWKDRDFLKVIIPRALLDPSMRNVLVVGTSRRIPAIIERLKHFKECQHMADLELEAVAHLVEVLGFGFGFLRPVLLGQDPTDAEEMAATIARTCFQAHRPS